MRLAREPLALAAEPPASRPALAPYNRHVKGNGLPKLPICLLAPAWLHEILKFVIDNFRNAFVRITLTRMIVFSECCRLGLINQQPENLFNN